MQPDSLCNGKSLPQARLAGHRAPRRRRDAYSACASVSSRWCAARLRLERFFFLGLAHEKLASAGSISKARKRFHVDKALESYQHELEFARKIGSRSEEANALGNLANAYLLKGDHPRWFEMADDALSPFKELGDSMRVATACRNLMQLCDLPQVGQSRRKQEFIKTYHQMQAAMPAAVRKQWEASKRDPRRITRKVL